jgi:hypothetical protein
VDPGEARQFAQTITVAPNYFDLFGLKNKNGVRREKLKTVKSLTATFHA